MQHLETLTFQRFWVVSWSLCKHKRSKFCCRAAEIQGPFRNEKVENVQHSSTRSRRLIWVSWLSFSEEIDYKAINSCNKLIRIIGSKRWTKYSLFISKWWPSKFCITTPPYSDHIMVHIHLAWSCRYSLQSSLLPHFPVLCSCMLVAYLEIWRSKEHFHILPRLLL